VRFASSPILLMDACDESASSFHDRDPRFTDAFNDTLRPLSRHSGSSERARKRGAASDACSYDGDRMETRWQIPNTFAF
jgi:hypothetical protein